MKSILIILCFLNILNAHTPYRSLNQNNFYQVAKALNKPEWLWNYCNNNFKYKDDYDQYKKNNWVVSGQTMFQRKNGDCDDWVNFQKEVLRVNKYKANVYWVIPYSGYGHSVCIFEYNGKWRLMDNMNFDDKEYNSEISAVEAVFGKDTRDYVNVDTVNSFYGTLVLDEHTYITKKSCYICNDRLELHKHLTMCDPGIYLYLPGTGYGYLANTTKESIGYLSKLDNNYISGIGMSLSSHGYYADFDNANRMVSVHGLFLNSRIGMTFYFVDYSGIDFDFKIIDSKYIKTYLCYRNFEIYDIRTDLILNWISVILQKIDKDYIYGVGICLSDDLKISINNKSVNFNIKIPELNTDLTIKYRINDKVFGDLSIKLLF